jgi:hypothetical protein
MAFVGADVGAGASVLVVAGAFVVGALVGAFVEGFAGASGAGADVAGAFVGVGADVAGAVGLLEGADVPGALVEVDGELGAFVVPEGADVPGGFVVASDEGMPSIHWHLSPFVGSE